MNEKLQAQITQILSQIMTSVGEVKDFSVAQLPDIAQQYITYGLWSNAFQAVFHRLSPASVEDVKVGDIVYCKVNGKFYTHLVKAIDPNKGCLIGNNRGRINGWTNNVYGKVVEVL